MEVDQHISELLYDHDCVVVPSFGGFLASYSHARIHPTQHMFSPPSKKIAFNIFLKQNDGLLATYISNHEKLSYADALSRIERHVNNWQKELASGRKLIIEQIGTFYLDAEKNLQFDPVKNINYLRDAFGLSRVQYLPVKREGYQQKVEKQVKEIMTIRPSAKQEKRALKFSGKTKEKLLTTLIISGTLLWLSFNFYLITPHQVDLSTLNPFSSKNKTEAIKEEVTPDVKNVITVFPSKVDTVPVVSTAPEDPAVAALLREEHPDVKPTASTELKEEHPDVKPPATSVQPVAPSTEDQRYFIIGGAFQVRENADAFVKTLHAEGFPDARILDTTKLLKMVCFKGFATRAEALKEFESLKAANRSGWIYKW